MPALSLGDRSPRIRSSVFLAEGSFVIGDVEIGEDASVWFSAVLRGDINSITIGERTNIQDGCVLHVTHENAVKVGNDVTVGHRAVVHGCTIADECLIGMGSVILDGASLGRNVLVAAGAVVLQNAVVPEGSLVAGVPARIIRPLTIDERNAIRDSARHYVEYARSFRLASEEKSG
jgi:carbonic anhydrase/acetyltransferase-like protein (isoleucine patch superfamily)